MPQILQYFVHGILHSISNVLLLKWNTTQLGPLVTASSLITLAPKRLPVWLVLFHLKISNDKLLWQRKNFKFSCKTKFGQPEQDLSNINWSKNWHCFSRNTNWRNQEKCDTAREPNLTFWKKRNKQLTVADKKKGQKIPKTHGSIDARELFSIKVLFLAWERVSDLSLPLIIWNTGSLLWSPSAP